MILFLSIVSLVSLTTAACSILALYLLVRQVRKPDERPAEPTPEQSEKAAEPNPEKRPSFLETLEVIMKSVDPDLQVVEVLPLSKYLSFSKVESLIDPSHSVEEIDGVFCPNCKKRIVLGKKMICTNCGLETIPHTTEGIMTCIVSKSGLKKIKTTYH